MLALTGDASYFEECYRSVQVMGLLAEDLDLALGYLAEREGGKCVRWVPKVIERRGRWIASYRRRWRLERKAGQKN